MNDPEHLIKGLIGGNPNPIRESMTRVKPGLFTVRVWRDEPLEGDLKESRIEVFNKVWIAYHFHTSQENGTNLPGMIKEIASFARVSAVEVLDVSGDGELFYPDWR